MEKFVLWTLIIIFIILTFFNLYYLRFFLRKVKSEKETENKDLIYKLDVKIELQKYLVLAILTLITLFGIKRLSYLDEKIAKYERLEGKYEGLNTEQGNLKHDYENLELKFNELENSYKKSNESLKNFDLEIYKVNDKIEDATRIIPESNIRILSKVLVKNHLETYTTVGRFNVISHSDKEILEEIGKSKEILKLVGYSKSEIEQIINDVGVSWIK